MPSSPESPIVAHLDADAFYVSIELGRRLGQEVARMLFSLVEKKKGCRPNRLLVSVEVLTDVLGTAVAITLEEVRAGLCDAVSQGPRATEATASA